MKGLLMPRSTTCLLGLGALLGCTDAGASVSHQHAACRVNGTSRPLPVELRETSGLAQSRRDPALFWTHNDSGNQPILFALDPEGRVVGRSRVVGAALTDWEDIEAGPCGTGSCLYIADIGDNARTRQFVTIYSVPEPAPGSGTTSQATTFRVRFPDGPQDAEAMFRLPSGDFFLVSKGRHAAISLYRLRAPHQSDSIATLERVRELWPQPRDERNRVTSATATPDGRWIAIRTYQTLYLYAAAPLIAGEPVTPREVDLAPLREVQGEAIAMSNSGTVWLTTEAKKKKDPPRMSRLDCPIAGAPAGPGS
jgi:hypothetical protein